ncbi:MAG: hypothetical protein LC725_12755 [Lentisphaerae bacterium]|nr:hypothetical protein [Lentisphaerota bacterium]
MNTASMVRSARDAAQQLLFESDPAAMPGQVQLLNPTNGQELAIGQQVDMAWSAAAGAQGYLAGYLTAQTGIDEDAGVYFDFTDAAATNLPVPASALLEGAGEFSVYAMAGDTDILEAEEISESFLIVGAGDRAEVNIAEAPGLQATAGLQIARSYRQTIEGITFTVREYNPQQIQAPGTVYIQIKMPKNHLTVAFIKAFDMEGREYYSWSHKRVYKSKSKRYCHNIAVTPGTTIVIGEKTCDIEAANYSY